MRTAGLFVASALIALATIGAVGADKAADEKAIIANETKVTDAIARGDATALKALLASDGWSVDAGGVMETKELFKNLKQLKIDPGWKITDSRIVWVASNTAVHIYTWTGHGSFMGQAFGPVLYSSTVWHRNDDKWKAIVHQETTAAPK
jgi:hypothetical protein